MGKTQRYEAHNNLYSLYQQASLKVHDESE